MVGVGVATVLLDLFLSSYYTLFVYLSDWYATYWYAKGFLKRSKSSIKADASGRDKWSMVTENFGIIFCTLFPVSWLLAKLFLPDKVLNLDYSFRPIHTLISQIGIYACFDTWYYFIHRFVHQTPYLYKAIHKRHHDMLPINTYVTGHAEILENLIFTSPGLCLWIFSYFNIVETPNAWAMIISFISLANDFALVHVGYYDNWILYLINPFSFVFQVCTGTIGMYSRHELHHNLFTRNYAPMSPWIDRLLGTCTEYSKEHWGITFQEEQKENSN